MRASWAVEAAQAAVAEEAAAEGTASFPGAMAGAGGAVACPWERQVESGASVADPPAEGGGDGRGGGSGGGLGIGGGYGSKHGTCPSESW